MCSKFKHQKIIFFHYIIKNSYNKYDFEKDQKLFRNYVLYFDFISIKYKNTKALLKYKKKETKKIRLGEFLIWDLK